MIEIIVALISLVPVSVLIEIVVRLQRNISEDKAKIISIKEEQRRFQQALYQVWLPAVFDELKELVQDVLEKDDPPSTLVDLHYQRIDRIFDNACKTKH